MMLRVLNRKQYDEQIYKYLLFGDKSGLFTFGTNSKCEIKMKLDLLCVKMHSVIFQRINNKLHYADIELV